MKKLIRKILLWRFGYETIEVYVYFYPILRAGERDTLDEDAAREISYYGQGWKFISNKYIEGTYVQKIRFTYRRKK